MPRPIWSGVISFGLVTISVKVVAATENHNITFHQYHKADQGRIRYRKVCEIDGQVLRDDQISHGFETTRNGPLIEVTDADLDGMPLPTAKAIEIVAFVPRESIDPIRISDSYYLQTGGVTAAKPYELLRRALERSEKVAIAKFAWHGRERLGLLSLKENALVLHAMKWPDEIRDPSELAPQQVDLSDDEIERAIQLMETMAADDISEYRDHYRDALDELIEAKSAGRKPPQPKGEEKPTGQIVDLMAALERSVQAARESRGDNDDDEHASVHDIDASANKKAAAKKPAKKTASKKAAAKKKTSGHKPRSA